MSHPLIPLFYRPNRVTAVRESSVSLWRNGSPFNREPTLPTSVGSTICAIKHGLLKMRKRLMPSKQQFEGHVEPRVKAKPCSKD